MTTDADEPRPSWTVRFGHYFPIIAVVCMPISWSWPFGKLFHNATVEFVWSSIATVAALVFVAATVAQFEHQRKMCTLDASPIMLADPDAEITRHARRLRLWHRPVISLVLSILVFGFSIFGDRLIPQSTIGIWVYAVVGMVAVAVYLFVVVRTEVVHQHLTLWCPQCRRGRGEDDIEVTPVPTPDPAAPLTA